MTVKKVLNAIALLLIIFVVLTFIINLPIVKAMVASPVGFVLFFFMVLVTGFIGYRLIKALRR